jgi:hypothetical protein
MSCIDISTDANAKQNKFLPIDGVSYPKAET